MSDGYSEEEIAARLGDPAALASQLGESGALNKGKNKVFTVIGLCFADIFAGLFFILLAAFELVMAAAGISFAGVCVGLLGRLDIFGIIPSMPYYCGVILALALAALALLSFAGCVYYGAFLRQLVRAFSRFQKNALASASGGAFAAPPLSHLYFSPPFSCCPMLCVPFRREALNFGTRGIGFPPAFKPAEAVLSLFRKFNALRFAFFKRAAGSFLFLALTAPKSASGSAALHGKKHLPLFIICVIIK